jgi:hypothetical protein
MIGYTIQTTQAGIAHPTPGPIKPNGQQGYNGPLGLPAIKPRADLATSSGPRFTAADVRQYLQTVPLDQIPNLAPDATRPVIASIQFMTAKAAGEQNGSLDVPDATPVCVVSLTGSFVNARGGAQPGEPTRVYHKEILIFDGYTGNLLGSVDIWPGPPRMEA